MTTALEKLILANNIDFKKLTSYKYLSLPFILERNYDSKLLSIHPDITLDYIMEHPHIEWNFDWISGMNTSITLDDIIEHQELPWNYSQLSFNPNTTIEFILNNKDKSWDWTPVSRKATDSAIQMYPAEPWDFHYLTHNLKVSFEFIKQNPQYPWNYPMLASRGDILFEEIEKYNPDQHSMYKNYSAEMLKKYPLYVLNHDLLCKYANLDDLANLAYDTWTPTISKNANINLEFMRTYNYSWDINDILLYSQNITWDVILESDEEFHWSNFPYVYLGNCRN